MTPASANLDSIHRVIRESPEVAEHLKAMTRAGHGVDLGYGGGIVVWGLETLTMDNSPPAAERLNLSDHGSLVPADR